MRGRILVVDDDNDVLEVFQLLLRRKHDVVTMVDAEALLASDTGAHYDIAIFDHRIGRVTSNDLIPLLKKNPRWQSTHFVIHSGVADLKKVAADSLADGSLPKPSSIDEIQAYIDQVLENKR